MLSASPTIFTGNWSRLFPSFDRAEALSPSDADLLLNIAWAISYFSEAARAVSLSERSLALNPHYPDWYNYPLSVVHFFAEQYDKSIKYRLLVKEPVALDYAFLAMAYAYLGRTGDAEAAAANVKKLDPTWTAERHLIGVLAVRKSRPSCSSMAHARPVYRPASPPTSSRTWTRPI